MISKNNKYSELPSLPVSGDLSFMALQLQFFLRAGPKNNISYALWVNFVRVVDKAILEYEDAQRELKEFIIGKTGENITALFRAMGYIENCLCTIHLAVGFLFEISSDQKCGYPEIDKILKKYFKSSGVKKLEKFRNAIQHLDTAGIRDLGPSDAVCIQIEKDSIKIYQHEIAFSSLVFWLTNLHAVAKKQALWGLNFEKGTTA